MKLVIFGLTVSSSWGNGHATLWRGLIRALTRFGWKIVFFERDVPYYAGARDFDHIDGGELVLYSDWPAVAALAERHICAADFVVVTSYCPDGIAATALIAHRKEILRVFYDLDTPVTLAGLRRGEIPSAVGANGLRDFDLVLSYAGGAIVNELKVSLGARHVLPLYGHVDPLVHRPAEPVECFGADLSYIGTYAEDRQTQLESLLVEPARRCTAGRFVIAGAQYPDDFPWAANIFFVRHLPPDQHPQFYSSARLTLNITRKDMAAAGWCPSGRLFEAAACGAAIISDWWPGIDHFFEPGREILIARTTDDVLDALARPDAELRAVGARARRRAIADHTSEKRAAELIRILDEFGHRADAALDLVRG